MTIQMEKIHQNILAKKRDSKGTGAGFSITNKSGVFIHGNRKAK